LLGRLPAAVYGYHVVLLGLILRFRKIETIISLM